MRAGLPLAVAFVALLGGCGGHANVQATSGGGSVGAIPGGTSVNIQGQGRSTFGNLLGLGILVGVAYGSEDGSGRPGSYYSSNPFTAISGESPPANRIPELDPSRRIAVQDCTKPLEDWSANLKCR